MAKTLIVDDYAPSRKLLSIRLGNIGCEVLSEATTVAEALEAVEKTRFDLVMLDVIMPSGRKVDTFELFCSIRRNFPRTKVAVVSGVENPRFVNAYLCYGAIGYFLKPVNFRALSSRLYQHFPHLRNLQQPMPQPVSPTSLPLLMPYRPSSWRGDDAC